MTKRKVFLTGGDDIGWAVDEDMKLARQALEPVVDLVDLDQSEIVHGVWWQGLLMWPLEKLSGKRIICHVPGEPFRYFTLMEHSAAQRIVGAWITRTRQAQEQLRAVGVDSDLVPYLVDVDTFRPLEQGDPPVERLREEWALPSDAFLVGSFQRDTEGSDLKSPKLVKGPDLLLEILLGLRKKGVAAHAVLAGPRRHWIMRRLREESIPFTYIGKPPEGDDIGYNSLPRPTLNILYNLLDLYVVGSRSEGGPHAILEAAATRCRIISTRVGMAPEVLEQTNLFRTPADAVKIIMNDLRCGFLDGTVDAHYSRVQEKHRPESVRHLFQAIYDRADTITPYIGENLTGKPRPENVSSAVSPRTDKLTVGLWHSFFKPPYGGGNQFMLALRKQFQKFDLEIRENELHDGIDAYVLNSIHFDVERFLDFSRKHRLNVIHRIDGPIHLIRGYDREKDELCYQLNTQFASATVLQSAWTYQRIVEMGYKPVNPMIIHNAVDSDIFNTRGRIPFDRKRKIRLVATSWSNNPRKGGPTYKWIEKNLDWDRFEFTFVGNVSEQFERAKHIPPVSSEELSDLLRQHDIYITASRNDPCSNALIEAMACGLPALYINDGGHPELVGFGGLPFNSEDEIIPQLENLVEDYESFQRMIAVSAMEDVAGKYLALIREAVK